MDPVSIAANVAGLAVVAGKIYMFLQEAVDATNRADTNINSLCREVSSLRINLSSLDHTLQECKATSLALAHVDGELWISIEMSLRDFRQTLDELEFIVDGIQHSNTWKPFRKANLAVKLEKHSGELNELQDKISKSNYAVQTSLAVLNVSLSLRQNTSQNLLFQELHNLRRLVEKTQQAARETTSERVSRSLKGLANLAQTFHSNASSTASTRYGQSQRGMSTVWAGSEPGDLSDVSLQRIHNWNQNLVPVEEGTYVSYDDSTVDGTNTTSTTADRETTITTPDPRGAALSDDGYGDSNSDLELEFLNNYEELGKKNFFDQAYTTAAQFLQKAINRAEELEIAQDDSFQRLLCQLSLCHAYQEDWDAAEFVLPLQEKPRSIEMSICGLCDAISLARLRDGRYEEAYNICKQSLQSRRRFRSSFPAMYNESIHLLADICESQGDSIQAAAIRLSATLDQVYDGVYMRPRGYLDTNSYIIDRIFGIKLETHAPRPDFTNNFQVTQSQNLETEPLLLVDGSVFDGNTIRISELAGTSIEPTHPLDNSESEAMSSLLLWGNSRHLLSPKFDDPDLDDCEAMSDQLETYWARFMGLIHKCYRLNTFEQSLKELRMIDKGQYSDLLVTSLEFPET